MVDGLPSAIGLSPRVRGKPIGSLGCLAGQRSIPACAGEASRMTASMGGSRVYPRVCGGSQRLPQADSPASGLSPRVRGKRLVQALPFPLTWSIPACAGEAPKTAGTSSSASVYPRVCGGSQAAGRRRQSLQGLSPRVRGKQAGQIQTGGKFGSIPACAGEANGCRRLSPRRRVYPRVCGGSRKWVDANFMLEGLSPRVRGKPGASGRRNLYRGSIPACAGEAQAEIQTAQPGPVYPRVCGGSILLILIEDDSDGLSPRVRGKPPTPTPTPTPTRSIPACAGEAGLTRGGMPRAPVYPRVCGGSRSFP